MLFVGRRGDLGVRARDGSLAEICGATARPLRGEEDGRRGMTGGVARSARQGSPRATCALWRSADMQARCRVRRVRGARVLAGPRIGLPVRGEEKELGRAGWKERGDGLGRAGAWAGPVFLGWAGLLKGSVFFLFPILFYFQTPLKLKPFEFKFKFEFKPSTQTKRTMHQHECNHKIFKLR